MDGHLFRDRREAGVALAERLQDYSRAKDTVVLALPRGGVVVGYEIARILRVPLDVFVTHKLGFPGQPELAVGAVSETGSVVLNPRLAREVPEELLDQEIRTEKAEIARRVRHYRGGGTPPDPKGKTIILVDDGLATGATARVAVEALKQEKPKRLVVAVPVAPEDTAAEFDRLVDSFLCVKRDPGFYAVGAYYDDFNQISDEEVRYLLRKAAQELKAEMGASAEGVGGEGI